MTFKVFLEGLDPNLASFMSLNCPPWPKKILMKLSLLVKWTLVKESDLEMLSTNYKTHHLSQSYPKLKRCVPTCNNNSFCSKITSPKRIQPNQAWLPRYLGSFPLLMVCWWVTNSCLTQVGQVVEHFDQEWIQSIQNDAAKGISTAQYPLGTLLSFPIFFGLTLKIIKKRFTSMNFQPPKIILMPSSC